MIAESRHTFGSLTAEPVVLREIRDEFQRELVEIVKMACHLELSATYGSALSDPNVLALE